ncbi:MurR/RpiR family transcriptional regulator [uncultured Thomasclavelia sp.]|uniref:MurR/RpiR family transcriptional regulator n=1 Tax=uncultured Thomasclavelia sp. TaxID=3025759 RepID=UPI0025F16057|nr:MurR/RpiR family transcriptional regulator [uncultured Thomasclavelia sp.]
MIYDKLPIVFLSTLASEKQGATNSQIASYILNHLDQMQNLGIREMAEECNVAISSISRFCKEIGLRDFAELKEMLSTTNLYFQQDFDVSTTKHSLNAYAKKINDCINQVANSLDIKAIIELCQDIKKYKRVAIFGLLKAGAVALNLQVDLLMLGKQVYTNISYSQQIQYILTANEDDLIIIFSYTGSYFEYQDLRALTKKLMAPKIWMIASSKEQTTPYVNRYILFDSFQNQISHPYQLQFIASVIGQEYAKIHKPNQD